MVSAIEAATSSSVKTRYLPSSGSASEVDGVMSTSTSRKKVSESRIEIVSETCVVCLGGCGRVCVRRWRQD